MTEIKKVEMAIAYHTDTIKQTDDVFSDCSLALQAELAEQKTCLEISLTALTEKLHRLENKPLTWEELQRRIAKPVFYRQSNGVCRWILPNSFSRENAFYKQVWFGTTNGGVDTLLFSEGKFYDHNPERSDT